MREGFVPLINLGFSPVKDKPDMMNPSGAAYNTIRDIEFTPQILAGLLCVVFECVMNVIPDSDQIKFQKDALRIFKAMLKELPDHVDKVNIDPENMI